MKKKLLSLLLVVAMLVTTVSMGFSSIAANAAAAGKGAEAINAFSLTSGDITSANGTTTINIKSKRSDYNIRVNTISGKVILYQDTTSVISNQITIGLNSGVVCTSAGTNFNVTASNVQTSGLIRYEVGYDLLNTNGTVAYSGLTGYGYGAISAWGNETGTFGPEHGEPSTKSDWGFSYWDDLRTYYVQVPNLTLNYKSESDGGGVGGVGSRTASLGVVSGTAPSTLSVDSEIKWEGGGAYSNPTHEEAWLVLTTPSSGAYNFSIQAGGVEGSSAKTWATEMLYRADGDKNTALNKANDSLNKNLEKSYYTTESWNNYLAALENALLTGKAFPGYTYAFRTACQKAANTLSLSTNLTSAEESLIHAPADYAAFDQAVSNFNNVKNATAEVYTYQAGATQWGTTTTALYDSASVSSVQSYIDGVSRGYMKYDQPTVDAYTTQVIAKTNSLAYAPANYTYLNIAKAESEAFIEERYTYDSWTNYKVTADTAIGIDQNLKANSQTIVNNSVRSLIQAKSTLQWAKANTTDLTASISEGDSLKDQYNSGTLITTLEGFSTVWAEFETAYNAAIALVGVNADQQDAVDVAAANLAAAIERLAVYRVLDTTVLSNAIRNRPAYTADKYVTESYSVWQSLVREGSVFIQKAAATYTASDRKTYNDYDEMVRLADMINEAFKGLELVKADFTALNAAVAKIPADDVLSLYQDEYVNAIKELYSLIDYGATFEEQDDVDALALSIEYTVAELTDEHLKPADYTEVDAAIEKFRGIDTSIRTVDSVNAVQAEIDKVDRTKNIKSQDIVDAYADAINEAIANLQYIEADYSKVEAAIAAAEAVENKDWYGNYDRVQAEIDAVDWSLTIDKQAAVDAYADAINNAVKNLTVADADYSGVRDAIAQAETLEPLSDFTKESVEALDLAISKVVAGYTKDRQAEVDAMEAEIRAALGKMELLPADYTAAQTAIDNARSFKAEEYQNYDEVETAIAGIDKNLNCRQYDILNAQIKAIYTAVGNLKLLPANYDALNKKIEDARYAYANGPYEYTAESIQAVEDVIDSINWDYDIQHQADVDAYIPLIEAALGNLKYVRADYSGYDAMIEKYNNKDATLYAGLDAVYADITLIPTDLTIDKQAELNAMVEEINTKIDNLSFADANYTLVNQGVQAYEKLDRDHYNMEDLIPVDSAYRAVVFGLKANEQARVTEMGENLNNALAVLATKIKDADLTNLNVALNAANAKINEMSATGYDVDWTSFNALQKAMALAEPFKTGTPKIDQQEKIDDVTAQIIEATANLQYVFSIITEDTSVIIDGNYIYGFEEGTMTKQAEEMIKFVGPAEIKFVETRNGFGTGTIIQFVSTQDGSILASYTVVVFGDANGDSVIDMFDVAYMCELISTFEEPSDVVLKALDVNPDGYIDATDLTILTSLSNMDATLKQDGTMGTY